MPRTASPRATVADRLHSAAIHLLRYVRRQDLSLGIGPTQASALSVLVFAGPKRLGELAAIEQVKPPTMTRVVAALVHGGLAEMEPDPSDRRSQIVSATGLGRRIMRRGRDLRVATLTGLLDSLTQDELDCLDQAAELVERVIQSAATGSGSPNQRFTNFRDHAPKSSR